MEKWTTLNDLQRERFAESLVKRWLRPLTRFASYLLDPDLKSEDADVAEEALAVCWRRVATGTWSCEPGDSVETFGPSLYRTVRQLVLNRNRKFRCSSETDTGQSLSDSTVEFRQRGPEAQAEHEEKCHSVRRAVLDLPPDFREVVVLRYMEEQSVGDVSRILQIPEGTVKSRCARALALLRSKLSHWFDGEMVAAANS